MKDKYLQCYISAENKEAIIKDVRKNSVEETPIMWFIAFEGNEESFLSIS